MMPSTAKSNRPAAAKSVQRTTKVVILAGGHGTRLRPYTHIFPKPLLPIGELPVLEVVIRRLVQAGLREIVLATGYLSELIQAYFQDGRKFGVHLTYWKEEQPLGTAGPLAGIEGLNSTFLVMNGDLLTDLSFEALLAHHRNAGAVATVTTHRRTVQVDYGVLDVDARGLLQRYTEKPSLDYLVSAGIFAFEPDILRWIPRGKRLDIPDLLMTVRQEKRLVATYEHTGFWLDIGRPEDYEIACRKFQEHREQFLPEGT